MLLYDSPQNPKWENKKINKLYKVKTKEELSYPIFINSLRR